MKMRDAFDLPVRRSIMDIEDDKDVWLAECGNYSTAIAAAHAINCHDELVEVLERMVIEGQNVYVALAQMGWGAEDFRKAAENAVAILNKAKGTNQ